MYPIFSFDSSTGRINVNVTGAYTRQLQMAPNMLALLNTSFGNAPDGFGGNRITINDGGGNFNIRGGCYNDGGDRYAGGVGTGACCIVLNHNSGDGSLFIRIAEANTGVAGDPITWTTEVNIYANGNMYIKYGGSNILKLTPTGDLYIVGEIHEVTSIT